MWKEDNGLGVDDVMSILCSRALENVRRSNFAQTTKIAPRYWPVTHVWAAALTISRTCTRFTMGPDLPETRRSIHSLDIEAENTSIVQPSLQFLILHLRARQFRVRS